MLCSLVCSLTVYVDSQSICFPIINKMCQDLLPSGLSPPFSADHSKQKKWISVETKSELDQISMV